MAWGWKPIADLTGRPGDAAALQRFDGIDYGLDILDSYSPVDANDYQYAIPFADEDGFNAGGVLADGTFNFEKAPSIAGMGGVTYQPVYAPGRAFLFVDKDGYVASEVKDDGTTINYKGAGSGASSLSLSVANDSLGYTRTAPNKVCAIGDSLTEGYFGGVPSPGPDSWPSKLSGLLGGSVAVTNLGTTGYAVDEEAIKVGAFPIPLTVAGGSIPASGPVTVTTAAVVGWVPTATRTFAGSLAGVPGAFKRSPTEMTFTRTTTGTVTAVPSGTGFVSSFAGRHAEILLILLGRNDVTYNITGAESTVAEHILAGVKRIVDWQSRDIKKVLVLAVTNTQSETTGTAGHGTVIATNAALSEAYGPRFLDIRTRLVRDAIYAAGITPTSEDLTAMAADAPPPSVMDDNTHWSRTSHTYVAGLVNTYLTDRDWTIS